jgi:hypothetical protein
VFEQWDQQHQRESIEQGSQEGGDQSQDEQPAVRDDEPQEPELRSHLIRAGP